MRSWNILWPRCICAVHAVSLCHIGVVAGRLVEEVLKLVYLVGVVHQVTFLLKIKK